MAFRLNLSRPSLLSGVLALSFSLGASPVMANLFGKSELSGAWNERFEDVTKLKAYTDKGIKVNIEDSIIGQYDLTDAVFDGASFRDNEWNETTGKNITFSNTIFRNNTFNSAELENSVFTNVTFEDSEFNRTSFYRSTLAGVKFIRCKFKSSSFQQINKLANNSTVVFDTSTIEKVEFAEANASFSFNHSTLTDARLTDLVLPSSLTFENSKLQDVDMDRSKLTKLVLDNVTGGGQSGFNGGSVVEVEVRNSAMGFDLNGGTLGKVTFVNSRIEGGFNSSSIKELQIINCKGMEGLGLYEAKIDTLQISNCPVNNIDPSNAVIQNFSVDKSSIVDSEFKRMTVENFTLTDVNLGGKLDFTNAQVKNLITKNITKQPGLNLILTGSNVKF